MEATIDQLQLHMPGLLKLLGEHLYSDPRVAFRELVQNAQDSCARWAIAREADQPSGDLETKARPGGDEPEWRPRIEVEGFSESGRRWLRFRDNGQGLDADEIREFVATIGRGQTGVLREALEASGDRASAEALVGQFGVGLLSAFLLGDRVELRTRRRGEDSPGWRWVCEGQQTYRLQEDPQAELGGEVLLRLRPQMEHFAESSEIEASLRRYARYLDVPIYVQNQARPLNAWRLPWDVGEPRLSYEALAMTWAGEEPPLAVIALEPFEDEQLGHVELRGVLAIPPGSHLSLREYGDVAVMIRRMIVSERERGLLPNWARFVTGVLDCPRLQPTASRESLRHDALFSVLCAEIERQLLRGLRRIWEDRPRLWEQIIEAHESLLKRWSLNSQALFEAVADRLRFHTTRGRQTLPQYLQRSDGALYLFDTEQQARTMSLMLESARRPVIDAQFGIDSMFLEVYAQRRGLRLVRELDHLGVLQRVEQPEPGWLALREAFAEAELQVVLTHFEPVDLPLLLDVPRRLQLQRLVNQSLEEEKQPADPMGGLLGAYAAQKNPGLLRTLHLNVDNPLMQRLVEMEGQPSQRAAIAMLKQMARMMSGERLTPQELVESMRQASEGLQVLLDV